MKGSVPIVRSLIYARSTGSGQDALRNDRELYDGEPYIYGESEDGMMGDVTADWRYAQLGARTVRHPADAARVCENNQRLIIHRFIYYR